MIDINQVKQHYNRTIDLYSKYLGDFIQAGTLKNEYLTGNVNPYHQTIKWLLRDMEVKSGMRILDAGCGLCGPAIFLASSYNNIYIDAVTISEEQVKYSQKSINESNLTDRIKVILADYHHLQYNDNNFDAIFFFESIGYSSNHNILFKEISRVLKPNGYVYIKDVFVKEEKLSEDERCEIKNFNTVFQQLTPRRSKLQKVIEDLNFKIKFSRNLSQYLDYSFFYKSMKTQIDDHIVIDEISDYKYFRYENLPVYFGDIAAIKESK